MNNVSRNLLKVAGRKRRVRAKIVGRSDRPRLSVHISNKHVVAQIIDDATSKTLAYSTTVGETKLTGTMVERAAWVGAEIAKKAKTAKVKTVVLDRGSKLYHGRVKALADAARENGLEF